MKPPLYFVPPKLRNIFLYPFWMGMLMLVLVASTSAQTQATIHGIILDATTSEPIPDVYISIQNSRTVATSDQNGHFMIAVPSSHATLVFTHVGYQRLDLPLHNIPDLTQHITVSLSPVAVESDALVITANRTGNSYNGINNDLRTRSVDDYLATSAGLDLVTRANMARDPVVRGLRDSRVAIMVDGMRLTPACVDGMDPATAYIETDNLKSIEINKGFDIESSMGSASGPAVNFSLARPTLAGGLKVSSETGYHAASTQKIQQGAVTYGTDTWALRLSGTYRDAGDYHAGNNSPIHGSGFRKGNILTSLVYQPSPVHHFNLRYIGDFAGKIGYPNLIMDTRQATAHILGFEHKWNNPVPGMLSVTSNIYLNTVIHKMDDYDRDVTSRSVMPNMYMPMYGETLTSGLSSEAIFNRNNHYATVQFETYRIDAFADMLMEHVNPAVRDMYLVNLGDVTQHHIALTASYRYVTPTSWHFGGRINIRGEHNRLAEESARATYRAEYPEISDLDPVGIAYLAGLTVEKELHRNLRLGLGMSSSSRLADHMERYGYYIYQPLDGFFYFGNPGLRPETSQKVEVFAQFGSASSTLSGSFSAWVNQMDNYIAGHILDDMFKRYQNMGTATLTGFEAEITANIHPHWRAGTMASFVHGTHNRLNEPLPMIPPLKGSAYVQRQGEWLQLEGRVRWAAAQNRIARTNSLESRTDAHILFDVFSRMRVSRSVSVQLGIENIFDRLYTEHLSVNAIPSVGRNIQTSLRISL